MEEHTEEKLLIYKEYLTNYLSVMCNSRQYLSIFVWEPFAGMGLDEDGKSGSALIATKLIKGFREKHKRMDIRLFLNELDESKYEKLKTSINDSGDFVQIYNVQAEQFLSKANKLLEKTSTKYHNLFFIDPYGYTQYSQANLNQLSSLSNSEYLIFVPTQHIYRFVNVPNSPARQFALDLGIDENIQTIDSFAEKLTEKLKEKAGTEFGYNYKLENKSAPSSVFHLFFVTKHIKGAEKFLEAKNKVKEKLKTQLTFLDPERSKIEDDLKVILSHKISNKDLYAKSIQNGYLPKEIRPILKELEESGNLEIDVLSGRRNKGAFYLRKCIEMIFIRYKP